jgi:hypothetical protein
MRYARTTAWTAALAVLAAAATGAGCGRRQPLPPLTGTIEGEVRGAGNAPLGRASVELLPGASAAPVIDPTDPGAAGQAAGGDPVSIATGRTGPKGTFRLDRIPSGRFRIRARAPGYAQVTAQVSLAPPATARIVLRLPPAVALEGRIEDQRKAPVPLARVLAFAVPPAPPPGGRPAPQAPPHQAQADEAGRYRIPDLAPGLYKLLIEAPGLGTMEAGPVTAPDPALVVALPGESRSIRGTVTSNATGRAPSAVARVLLAGEALSSSRTSQTGVDGRFAFAGVGAGSYALRAEAAGLVSSVVASVAVKEGAEVDPEVTLLLVEGAFARGTVVDDGGRPVSDAAIEIDSVPQSGLWPPIQGDGRGAWTSPPLGPGTYRVRARRAGFVARRTATVVVPAAIAGSPSARPEIPPVQLVLVRAGTLVGRVVDERDAPLAGASVYDRLAEAEALGVIWAPLPPAAEAAALASTGAQLSPGPGVGARRAVTDTDGRFAIAGVPPGRLRVEVLHPGTVPFRSSMLTLAPGARVDLGSVRLSASTRVSGQVVDGDGAPLGGVRVTASGGGASGAGLYAVTAANGSFSLPLGPGTHRLVASAAGRAGDAAIVSVGAGVPAPARVTLRLARGEHTVEGSAHDVHGRPLGGARISVRTGDAPADGVALAQAVADAGGHFRVAGLPAAPLVLEVRHPRYAVHQTALTPGARSGSLAIRVPVPGGIDGEVHERFTGAPVARFELSASGPAGASARVEPAPARRKRSAAPAGWRFELPRLVPGPWTLRIRAEGYKPFERTIDVPAASAPGEITVRDLRLELERGS